ncbi:MAG: hypothetical protein Q8P22_06690 [Chloroflexota bacterium]|nr:hypothetical protein [Chloroflexota bacterium]
MARKDRSRMDEYLCLHCGRAWRATVERYRDWTRRKCPGCGKRRTVKKELFERAVVEFAESLRHSPPPYPPQPSAVSAVFALLADTFPGSSPAATLWDVYQEALRRTDLPGEISQPGKSGQAHPRAEGGYP